MNILYLIEPTFFDMHLNGARIPVFLHMLRALRDGARVQAFENSQKYAVSADFNAATMDAAFMSDIKKPTNNDRRVDLAVVQKGQPSAALQHYVITDIALMLNDPRSRQAANQLHELLSGRFGLDAYRVSAPWRYVKGRRRDLADMLEYDIVYVQSEVEKQALEKIGSGKGAKIEVFKNSAVTIDLFPDIVRSRVAGSRTKKFLLPVPPGIRREREYARFLGSLADSPDLLADLTVLSDPKFARHIPSVAEHASHVEDFQKFLEEFDCVLVPTKHYTGLNNRVFQAACGGCQLIASPEALTGLIPGHPVLETAPKSFQAFKDKMKSFPEGSVAPEIVLSL